MHVCNTMRARIMMYVSLHARVLVCTYVMHVMHGGVHIFMHVCMYSRVVCMLARMYACMSVGVCIVYVWCL